MRLSSIEPRLHFTVRQPTNILSVITGAFHPSFAPDQFLFHLESAFELYEFDSSPRTARFTRRFGQPFLSAVYAVARGPSFGGFDSFFASRDDDVLLFRFEPADGFFVAVTSVTVPRLAKPATHLHFSDPTLFASASHGGFAVFLFSGGSLGVIATEKPCGCVLACGSADGGVYRIESARGLTIYGLNPFEHLSTRPVHTALLACLFFAEQMVLTVYPDRIEWLLERPYLIDFPTRREGEPGRDPAVGALTVTADTGLIWFRLGCLVRIGPDLKPVILLDKLRSVPFRVIPLDSQHCLLLNSPADHDVLNFQTGRIICSVPSAICMSRTFSVRSFSGGGCVGLAPCSVLTVPTLGHRAASLVLTSQGRDVRIVSSLEVGSAATAMMGFECEGRMFAVLSFASSSRLFEITDSEIAPAITFAIDEAVPTLAICELPVKGERRPCQFTARELLPVFKPSGRGKGRTFDTDVVLVACNGVQMMYYTRDKRLILQILDRSEARDAPPGLVVPLEGDEVVTALALGPANDRGWSDWFVVGIRRDVTFLLRFSRFSTDAQEYRLDSRALEDRMQYSVCSICFVGSQVVIGLDYGVIVSGDPDIQSRHILNVQAVRVGDGPVRFSRLNDTQLIALSSRPCLLTFEGRMHVVALCCDSLSCAITLRHPGLFLAASGRTISIYRISDRSPSLIRIPIDAKYQAGGFCVLDYTQYILVGHQYGFSLYDLSTGRSTQVVGFVNQELVLNLSLPFSIPGRLPGGTVVTEAMLVASVSRVAQRGNEPAHGIRLLRVDVRALVQPPMDSFNPVQQLGSLLIGSLRPAAISVVAPTSSTISVVVCSYNRVRLYRLMGETFAMIAEFVHVSTSIRFVHAVVRPSAIGIWAADRSRSVSFLTYSEETRGFRILAEEGYARPVSALAPDGFDAWVGDRLGNIMRVDGPPDGADAPEAALDKRLFRAGKRLRARMHYHVGGIVTGIAISESRFKFVWYSTIAGAVGGFMTLGVGAGENALRAAAEKNLKLLQAVEAELAGLVFARTRCDHFAFRNKFAPALNIVDLDFLSWFTRMADERKAAIAAKVGTPPKDIEAVVDQMCAYFRLA